MNQTFWTEKEIENYLERYTVGLYDSKGNRYSIDATRMTWQWFLIITHDQDFNHETILDNVLAWQIGEHPSQELSYLFEEYVANIIEEMGSEFTDQMFKNFKNSDPDTHPLFKQLKIQKSQK